MTWNRLRWTLLLVGISVMVLGTTPILLLVAAFELGGFLGGMAFVGALLLSPMLLLLRLGILILGAVWKGQQVVVMGRQWGQARQPPRDPNVIDGDFEDEP